MSASHPQKEIIRRRLLEQRKAISETAFRKASSEIISKLRQQSEYKKAKTIHCYVSINNRREVNTHGLIKKMLATDKDVVVPVTKIQEGTLSHIRLSSYDKLEENKWGVLEPTDGDQVSPDLLDLVIVPMVGGDEQCNRIGYGQGFYDRFLSDVDCPKIGLLFEKNVVKELPTEDYDIPLDKILTEARIIIRD